MKTMPLSCLVALCGLVSVCHARSLVWRTTGIYYERLTSHHDAGFVSLSDAQTICTNEEESLPTVSSEEELAHLQTELTELYWSGSRLKPCDTLTGFSIWLNHRVTVQGDTPRLFYHDIDDVNGQYCAVLSTVKGFANDGAGDFILQGRDCSSLQQAVCVRTAQFREVYIPRDEATSSGDQATAEAFCQSIGMDMIEIDEDSDEDNLEAEINRLGWPRQDHQAEYSFWLKNKVGGNPGDVVTHSQLVPGSNCLRMRNGAEPDIELYDLVVDDCTTHGRGLCTTTDPGRFYDQLTVVDVENVVNKSEAEGACAAIDKELIWLQGVEDEWQISKELVRLGIYDNMVLHGSFRTLWWVKNTSNAPGTETDWDTDLVPLGQPAGSRCVWMTSEYSGPANEFFRAESPTCDAASGFTVCVDPSFNP